MGGAMTIKERFIQEGPLPILLSDGAFGLVIRWPNLLPHECGVQVPGEDDIRWIPIGRIKDLGQGALVEVAE